MSDATLAHATFGDMWYCTGQSNMWLPVQHTFSRNESVTAIAKGKYSNIRGMFAASASTPSAGKSWKTAQQAISDGNSTSPTYSLFQMGATCWYFAQELVERGVTTPIGIADTAIGGQRIEEFMNNASYPGATRCPDEEGGTEVRTAWNGQLFAKQMMPFVDMTLKGFTWYQGENNMGNIKGNAAVNVGYSCKQRELVKGWRAIWSETKGTTDPTAPFGLVTLASSGTEGGPNIGAMRLAQTAGHGVLPNNDIPNSFLAQAGDLDDPWGPAAGPCLSPTKGSTGPNWDCCTAGREYTANRTSETCLAGTNGHPEICDNACAAAAGTSTVMGGIHPRNKKPVGFRLGTAGFNVVYGGKGALTGPTLAGCTVDKSSLKIEFNSTLLGGEKVMVNKYNSSLNNVFMGPPPAHLKGNTSRNTTWADCYDTIALVCKGHLKDHIDCSECKDTVPGAWEKLRPACGGRPINNLHVCCHSYSPTPVTMGGSLVEVLVARRGEDGAVAAAAFCVEPQGYGNTSSCPTWAGGSSTVPFNATAGTWLEVDILFGDDSSVTVDLTRLNGTAPVAVRYSWDTLDCCNRGNGKKFISEPCDDACPITTTTALLPANPFIAKLENGKCACVPPQVCTA